MTLNMSFMFNLSSFLICVNLHLSSFLICTDKKHFRIILLVRLENKEIKKAYYEHTLSVLCEDTVENDIDIIIRKTQVTEGTRMILRNPSEKLEEMIFKENQKPSS